MLTLGTLKLKSPYILSPLAGISDLTFRRLNRRFGAELAFTEMIDARSLCYENKKINRMLATDKHDRPLGVQLVGNEPDYLIRSIEILEKYHFDILDFNAACPVKKVTSKGKGASLLKNPKHLGQLLSVLVNHSPWPVTVKIRAGWDKNSVNATETARAAQDAGVAGIFLHGRTRSQGYFGAVDYEIIRAVKKILSVPVIASGDIFSAPLVEKMFNETGADAVAIARGALGNPWIFKELDAATHKKIFHRPTIKVIAQVMAEHLEVLAAFWGPTHSIIMFRKFFHWYTKGLSGTRPLRERFSHAKTLGQARSIIEAFKESVTLLSQT
ncbi:MAG: tRNA dihydrouridine synthase DusB [Candidatus Omnitrophota bacterium]|nr:tRNA dihydrouridine synthase DusB [Candidatus Omnitrophota bacterium]